MPTDKNAGLLALPEPVCQGEHPETGQLIYGYRADQMREYARANVEALAGDAAIGRVVWDYIDRMNDVCPEDPADKILADFAQAVGPKIHAALAAREASRRVAGDGDRG